MSDIRYIKQRNPTLKKMEENGVNPWPHKFEVDIELTEFIEKYQYLQTGETLPDVTVHVAGRCKKKDKVSGRLIFFGLESNEVNLQIFCEMNTYQDVDEFKFDKGNLNKGDIIGVIGYPGRTDTGELSVYATKIIMLSPSLHRLPKDHSDATLQDPEIRYRSRHFDLIMNYENRKIFRTRAKIISSIRRYLDNLNFIEVETPILHSVLGGAAAKPFVTFYNHLKENKYLRIAPELYLKMCIVGGLDRVYEIGKNFRNESVDQTHNPEFSAIEWYMAYADYNDMMHMIEELLSSMAKEIHGDYKFTVNHDGVEKHLDFTPGFQKICYLDGIQEGLKADGYDDVLPEDLETEEAREFLDKLVEKVGVECSAPRSTVRLLDKLLGHYVEDRLTNPTFIIDYPRITTPLAKYHRSKPGLVERFELFCCSFEIANAYTELNNPFVQRENFERQVAEKSAGDEETMEYDEDFCVALEYGMPPTGGFGMGIDRLVMIMTNNFNIKEVMLFPTMSSIEPKNDGKKKAKTEKKENKQKNTENTVKSEA
eukprot:TRINITY_DN2809_c0_g1_i1.p1 TRINITY_DN2809_c0_g1~~TRINITY_DN2809_c0_g1_i1.p1  ORF type:complete len:539 (+),score=165.90 TRINITY_DN2809_c0_g1_i1:51-1667(+)